MYVRVEKSGTVEIPKGATYEEAIDYAYAQDAEGCIEFDLSIEVMDDSGEVITEADWPAHT